jgi:hypothetical protein
MQELNSILIEGRLMLAPDHRLSDNTLFGELIHDGVTLPVAIMPGKLADTVQRLGSGRTVRMVGRVRAWPLITGAMIVPTHIEFSPMAKRVPLMVGETDAD